MMKASNEGMFFGGVMSELSVAFQTLEESMENTETVILACSGLLLLLQLSLQFILFFRQNKTAFNL